MQYCKRCVMPDTKPGVFMDAEGICSACRAVEKKQHIDWDARHQELAALCESIKAKNTACYDCIVPVSGGKDSTYQAWTMKEKYGMNVLGVCLGAHLPTQEGIYNLNNMVDSVGIDLIKVNLKPGTFRKLRRKAFLRQGEPNWAEHCAMFSSVSNVAMIYDIPLIVWGEDIAVEFGGKSQNRKADATDIHDNDLIKDKTIDDWLDDDIRPDDVYFYRYPDFDLFGSKGVKSIYLGYYHNWDGKKHYEVAKSVGFKPRAAGPLSGNLLDYDNIDEKLCEINIWLKYIKFGFWRPTDQCCYQIWNGRMSREEAVEIVNKKQDEFPQEYFVDFLRYHDLTETQFWETVEKFRNHDIWEKQNGKWKLKTPLR